MVANKSWGLDSDGNILPYPGPRCETLLVAAGCSIPDSIAAQYNLYALEGQIYTPELQPGQSPSSPELEGDGNEADAPDCQGNMPLPARRTFSEGSNGHAATAMDDVYSTPTLA